MTLEDTIVCLCTRQNFELSHQQKLIAICQSQTIGWNRVYETAEQHQVAPLVYANLLKSSYEVLNIPPAVFSRFKKAYIHNVFVKKRTETILKKILTLFAQKGIDLMLVKGAALSRLVYERPWYTISHDIDLVIRARREEIDAADHREIVELLEGFNYEGSEFKEHIEYDYYEHHDITMNKVLTVDSQRIWGEARKIRFQGYDVFVMTPEDMLLATAINSCRKRFFRLKSLCDLATIVETSPDLDWDRVVSKAQAYKCNTILYTAFVVTQATLGCHIPDRVLNDLKVHPIRALMISYLVSKLCRRFPLINLFTNPDNPPTQRKFSWPLCLTYITYRFDLLGPKLGELYMAWRNPSSPVPG